MKETKTNLEMLLWGVEHIGNNHGFAAFTDYQQEEEPFVMLYGANVLALSDMQMLAEDCQISKDCVEASFSMGYISITLDEHWLSTYANKPYKNPIWEFWKRVA